MKKGAGGGAFERVGAGVAVFGGVGFCADAYAVKDEKEDSFHGGGLLSKKM
ncbi:hypothetical protein HMPREF1548_03165 [Clostridium sp. KLE 1755]|nr:hypothetical protein HMPREF1548_03165 [Clostridium sp. KLE 1755]